MPIQIERIPAARIASLPKAQTVFFFPVGALEDHGPHLPLGMDVLEAEKLCLLAAERLEQELPGWQGVIMPRAPLSVDSNTTQTALTVRAHVLRDYLVDQCLALGRLGFIHFVCFSGSMGPKQLTAIEDAGKIANRKLGGFKGLFRLLRPGLSPRPSLVSASSALTSLSDLKRAAFWPNPAEHGGTRDTSVALYLLPEAVDLSFKDLSPISPKSSLFGSLSRRFRHVLSGYWGNPAPATQEAGEKALISTLGAVFPKLRAVWEGANPNALFRSWYSILPPNKSFFRAWLLVLAFVVIMSTLLWWNFRDLVGSY